FGELDDIEKAIKYATQALDSTPDSHPDWTLRLVDLGVFCTERFRRLGDLDDLEKSIEHQTHALSLTPDDHPDLSRRHDSLGLSHTDRFQYLGELDDLEKSIQYNHHAYTLLPDGHPDLPHRSASLGFSYHNRFQRLGELCDLEKGIELEAYALALTPDGHPDLADRHGNLGLSYNSRFRRLGELSDLEKAIDHQSQALELTPEGHPDLSRWHAVLGLSYRYRFQRLGELDNLDKAVELESHALSLTPDGHPDLPGRHAGLGVSYEHRFRRLGGIDDIEKSIEHISRAIKLTPDGHPDLTRWHSHLGVSYRGRFQHLGELDDLEKAIEHESRALESTPQGDPDLPNLHDNLGVTYTYRFQHLNKLDDLEKAIEHQSCALALTPDDHADLPSLYDNLGVSYTYRFLLLREPDDLDKAIEYSSRALAMTPEGHPQSPDRYFNQAHTVLLQYEHTGDTSHLSRSVDSFRRASQLSTGAPREVFQNALNWAKLAANHSFLNCIEAYRVTMDLLPHFIWLGATTSQRYKDLSIAENLAVQAASAAILHSDPKLALEWLEHARCVVWNQSLMLRSPLDQLQSARPDLAARLQEISMELHAASFDSSTSQALSSGSVNLEREGHRRRLMAKEYNDLLVQARKLPGFEDLLQPMKVDALVRAAQNGPIVAITCHKARCDALLILPDGGHIQHLSLPNFTEEQAQNACSQLETSLRRKGLRQRGVKIRLPQGYTNSIESVLLTLWKDVVKPIIDVLGLTNDTSADSLPHITWCPTGAMSFLPLHAAGDYEQPRSKVFDYAISSYTPTLTALLANSPSSLNRTSRVLAIGQANTPGHTPLPGTAKELENLKAHTQNIAEYSQLRDGQATTTAVLDAMEQHDWVHLACHAHQNIKDPTKSGFFLHDGTLDLAAINRRSFKNKGLAFLSACQTATGDEKLPDEAIHLASGMLMAGYPSVIATMWSVMDEDAPFVADKVYSELMRDGKIGNGEAGKALHYAVVALRDKVGEKEFATTGAVLDAMEHRDWVHLACHAHQNVEDPTKSGFFLHDGTLDLAAINQRSFKKKGLAFLSAFQTATGDDGLPDEAIHLASGMVMAGYPSVIATMWSVVDDDAAFMTDKVYAELMKDGKVGNGEAGKALHHALRHYVGRSGRRILDGAN
ncbi:hypothetical protein FRC11_001227, partial [Ceratobasidium sp. 423]